MTDLDLLVAGAMVSFLSMAGAYIAIRHRANEDPVSSFSAQESNYRPPVTVERGP